MKNTLIQHYNFTVPITNNTLVYSYTFKSDDLHKYLTGISLVYESGDYPTSNSIQIELRDDFKSILSFSPIQNWVKKPAATNAAYNLTDAFKPLNIKSEGKNFYLNVKATNITTELKFWVFFRQAKEELNCKEYDIQTFIFENVSLGVNYQINMPNDYTNVVGINAAFESSNDTAKILLDINDSTTSLLDPYSLEALKITENVNYDNSFFNCIFYSKNKQINVRFTANDTEVSIPNVAVSFLLIK